MSGFAGLFSSDGKPQDEKLLQRMAERLAFRGPDATVIRIEGGRGLLLHKASYRPGRAYGRVPGGHRAGGETRCRGRRSGMRAGSSVAFGVPRGRQASICNRDE